MHILYATQNEAWPAHSSKSQSCRGQAGRQQKAAQQGAADSLTMFGSKCIECVSRWSKPTGNWITETTTTHVTVTCVMTTLNMDYSLMKIVPQKCIISSCLIILFERLQSRPEWNSKCVSRMKDSHLQWQPVALGLRSTDVTKYTWISFCHEIC